MLIMLCLVRLCHVCLNTLRRYQHQHLTDKVRTYAHACVRAYVQEHVYVNHTNMYEKDAAADAKVMSNDKASMLCR